MKMLIAIALVLIAAPATADRMTMGEVYTTSTPAQLKELYAYAMGYRDAVTVNLLREAQTSKLSKEFQDWMVDCLMGHTGERIVTQAFFAYPRQTVAVAVNNVISELCVSRD